MQNNELLPCPWCGQIESIHIYTEQNTCLGNGLPGNWYASIQCGCFDDTNSIFTATGETEAEAKTNIVAAWNRRAPGWLPIEQCPKEWKDGRFLLLWNNNRFEVGRFAIDKSRTLYSHGWVVDGDRVYPTYIMPLPHAPEVEK